MRVLCVMWYPRYVLRLYEPALRSLAADGHELHLGFTNMDERQLAKQSGAFLERLEDEYPLVTYGVLPRRRDVWTELLVQLRALGTALMYWDPLFDNAPTLRARSGHELGLLLRGLAKTPLMRGPRARGRWNPALRTLEQAIPSDPAIEAAIAEQRPDVLLVTPLVHAQCRQTDYVKSAADLSLPCAIGVASWDNLTTKDKIQLSGDAVLVWNDAQRRELTGLHGVPADRVVITGAQAYDPWFGREPSVDRATFCAQVGLPAGRKILLYLCSSRFLQDDERAYIDGWIEQVRAHRDPSLREAGILVRPYPTDSATDFDDLLGRGVANVAVWPRHGQFPLGDETRDTYFDSIFHSAAVIGTNTSGLIEAGIVGRRCFSLLDPAFDEKQNGMPHFAYVRDSGFLVTARDMGEHLDQLAAELDGHGQQRDRMTAFLASFIRPNGLDRPATEFVAEALETLAGQTVEPPATPRRLRLLRWALWPIAAILHTAALILRPINPWREARRLRRFTDPKAPSRRRGAPGPPAGP